MSEQVKRLWEVEHDHYCNQGNYFARESVEAAYRSFADFLAEEGDSDKDYNLLFRWDWQEHDDDGEPNFNGDVNYRNGRLLLFWMGQRKGLYRYSTIEVCRADEPAVIAFLRPRWEHLRSLWMPLSGSLEEARTAMQQAIEAMEGLWEQKPGGGLHIDSASSECVLKLQNAIQALRASTPSEVMPEK